MSKPIGKVDEELLQMLIKVFVSDLRSEGLGGDIEPDIQLRQQRQLEESVGNALQQEFSNLGFIFTANQNMIYCDMPNNSHLFKQNSSSKHCAVCNLDYCGNHPLDKCVKCGSPL